MASNDAEFLHFSIIEAHFFVIIGGWFMKKFFLIALAICSLVASVSLACDIEGKTGFAPKNNLKISQCSIFTGDSKDLKVGFWVL